MTYPYAPFEPAQPPAQPTQPTGPIAPPKKHWALRALPWLFGTLAFVLGIGIGGAATADQDGIHDTSSGGTDAQTVEIETTPQACLDALDYADAGFGLASDALGTAAAGMEAAANFDIGGVRAATGDMRDVTAQITDLAPLYRSARESCRASK